MNKKEIQQEEMRKGEDEIGLCIIKDMDEEHSFVYNAYRLKQDCTKKDYLQIFLICEHCDYRYICEIDSDCENNYYSIILNYGVEQFCKDNDVRYRGLLDQINYELMERGSYIKKEVI